MTATILDGRATLATIKKDMVAIGPTLGASIYPAVQNLMLAARKPD